MNLAKTRAATRSNAESTRGSGKNSNRIASKCGAAAFGIAAALGLCLSGSDAWSADQGVQPSSTVPSEGGLEEVIVTAQKRSQTVFDVPISISALDGTALVDRHIGSAEDLTRSVPGFSFSAGGSGFGAGEGNTTIEMRGISSSTGTATVGTYLNDAPITTDMIFGTGAFIPSFFDLERVEVLRGPQGTLYGASSEGGTVKFVLADADVNKFSNKVSADVSSTSHGGTNTEESAVVNLPLSQGVFAIRLGGDYAKNSGWIDNYSLAGQLQQKAVNSTNSKAARLAARYVANDNLSVKAEVFYQRFTTDDSPIFYISESPLAIPTDGLYRQHKQVTEYGRDTMIVPSLTVEANLGFANLTSVTSGLQREFLRQADGTYYDSAFVAYVLSAYADAAQQVRLNNELANLPSPSIQPVTYHSFSQEVRLASRGDSHVKWVAGLYYQDQTGDGTQDNPVYNLSSTFLSIFGYGINSPQSPIGDPSIPDLFQPNPKYGDSLYTAVFKTDTKQTAAFGQLDLDFASKWHAALGMRYVHATNNFQVVQSGWFAFGLPPSEDISGGSNETTPKVTVKYDISPQSNIYASAAKGFRLGAHWEPLPVGAGNVCEQDYINLQLGQPNNDYGPDSAWSYELGSKSKFLNNSLSLNASVFYIEWKNIQQTMVLPICGYTWVFNAGDAKVDGVELELQYAPHSVPGLTFGLNGSVTHSEITKSIVPGTISVGQDIPFVPDATATAAIAYEWPLTGSLGAFVQSDYSYTGESKGSFITTSPAYINRSYSTVSASVGLNVKKAKIALYAKNLLNDQTIIQQPVVNQLVTGFALQPRTIGLRVSGSL